MPKIDTGAGEPQTHEDGRPTDEGAAPLPKVRSSGKPNTVTKVTEWHGIFPFVFLSSHSGSQGRQIDRRSSGPLTAGSTMGRSAKGKSPHEPDEADRLAMDVQKHGL
jgi:hypothetical protein